MVFFFIIIIFYFSKKISLDISFELSARQTIHMKCQDLYCKLQILLGAFRVNVLLLKAMRKKDLASIAVDPSTQKAIYPSINWSS